MGIIFWKKKPKALDGTSTDLCETKSNGALRSYAPTIIEVLNELDPMGLIAIHCPKDEYEQEAAILAEKFIKKDFTWQQVQNVFLSQFGEILPKKICVSIVNSVKKRIDLLELYEELRANETLREKLTLENGSIVLKVHDNFVVKKGCGNTYVNSKFYYDIEDQEVSECFCDFVANDKIIYVQYAHKHFGLYYDKPCGYFGEFTKKDFVFNKLKHRNDVELVFDNERVIYSAKDYMQDLSEPEIVELMYRNPDDFQFEKVLFSPDKRNRIVIFKKNGLYSYEIEKLTILDEHERKFTKRYAVWEPDWTHPSIFDSLEHLLSDVSTMISGWKEK